MNADAAATTSGSSNINATALGTTNIIVNAAVVTLDGVVVGTVADVQADVSGEAFIVASVNDSFVSEPNGFRISTDAAVFADQQVQIRMTEADMRASFQASADANASANVN